ncbi:hypothetical protein PES01_21860 [Pseudoalteromonas espejiana]|uniref:Uncharacterized protein n=1 Tax=Pseudoalteromonas espejiana TaxID=28107 RepID=A0A510XXI9_9GAMM|nr:hypothetical protein PES01_21860 [Pseudoalteromonas espejiana]
MCVSVILNMSEYLMQPYYAKVKKSLIVKRISTFGTIIKTVNIKLHTRSKLCTPLFIKALKAKISVHK